MVTRQIAALSKLCPESTALSQCGHSLTFRELNRKADLFAQYLGQCGLLPGGTVAIILERSFEWIIAALGIMRAAAAYVPLDPTWPDSRLCYAVNDSHASILVSRSRLSDRLQSGRRCIDPYRDAATIDGGNANSMGRTVAPDSLAYVIYTSGSTGVPKGVEITHGNLAHLIRWHRHAFHITPKDRVTHLAGLGFDAAAWEIWPNLCAGAAVILADEEVRLSPELIHQWIIRERVTVSFVPTIHAAPLMRMQWPADTELRCLLTGGDALQLSPPQGLPFALVNNYGPTECTVVTTSGLVEPGEHQTPSIGRPIDGASLYLLDELGEPVPDGTPGEIYIGGDGVGRGYRNLNASTAQCFLPDPFSPVPSARMFRTGDRAARLPNGEIQFLGRFDRQIKIRGNRIELDEIGTVLSRHPGVAFATAMAASSKDGEARLVGYVLLQKDAGKPTTQELQTYLLNWLPDYMVPSTIVELQSLPLSANGKLDVTALSQIGDLHRPDGLASALPLSPIAGKLLTIVRQVLENEAVTAGDNFFLAGGHSLLSMQLLVRIQDTFGVTMTLQQMYEAQTVDHLALLVEEALSHSLPSGVVALRPGGTRYRMFWIHHLGARLASAIRDDQPFFCVSLTAHDVELLGEAPGLESIAACLLQKVRATQPTGPYIIGGFCLGAVLAYELASQLQAAVGAVRLLVLVDPPNPSHDPADGTIADRWAYFRYSIKKARWLGPRKSINYILQRLRNSILSFWRRRLNTPEGHTPQELIKSAVFSYSPREYGGRVLLFLPSESNPHVKSFLGWQTVAPSKLQTHYVGTHHREMMDPESARDIADAIALQLEAIDHANLSAV